MSGQGKWEEFRRRAVRAAEKFGALDDAEDLAHAALLRWLEGYGKGQTVSQAVIDAYRKDAHRGAAKVGSEEYSEAISPSEQTHGLDYERMTGDLDGRDRAMVKLKYEWGFDGAEIADLFGIDKSRVCQRLKAIEEKVRERLKDEE